MKIETIETLATAGNKTTMAGAAMGGVGAFMASNLIGIIGVLVAIVGALVNLHYRRKANARHEAEHELRMARLRRGMDTPDTDLVEQGVDE